MAFESLSDECIHAVLVSRTLVEYAGWYLNTLLVIFWGTECSI